MVCFSLKASCTSSCLKLTVIMWSWKHQIRSTEWAPRLIKMIILLPLMFNQEHQKDYIKIKCLYNFINVNLWHRWENKLTRRNISKPLSHHTWKLSLSNIIILTKVKSLFMSFNYFTLIMYLSLKSSSIFYTHSSKR